MRNHGCDRLAWVNFTNDHNCEQALEKIRSLTVDNFRLDAVKSHPKKNKTPVRISIPLPENQVFYDYELCKKLITDVFDPEKKIDTYIVDEIESLTQDGPSNE